MFRRTVTVALSAMALIVVLAVPALAGHDHFVETPNGNCHQVAQGQTSIDDASHGGNHRFHSNVHLGATDKYNREYTIGLPPGNGDKNACP